jgi:hypothetical protein
MAGPPNEASQKSPDGGKSRRRSDFGQVDHRELAAANKG